VVLLPSATCYLVPRLLSAVCCLLSDMVTPLMKKDLLFTVIGIGAVAAVCFGLAQMRPELPPTPSQPYEVDAKLATPSSGGPAAGKVVMSVNGEPVTDVEFQTFVAGMPENMQQAAQSSHGRRLLADQVASLIALAQEGRKMGLDKEKETKMQVDANQTNVLAMAALRKLVTPSEARLREEYAKMKSNYDAVDLKHILIAYQGGQVPPPQGSNPMPLPVAMQKAEQIAAQLQA